MDFGAYLSIGNAVQQAHLFFLSLIYFFFPIIPAISLGFTTLVCLLLGLPLGNSKISPHGHDGVARLARLFS